MAMEYDGKKYRNLQEQVAYLTAKWQELADEIEEVRAQIPSKMIVEELPEEGDPLITYYVGPKGTEPDLYYEVWVWVQEEPDGPFVWRELEDTDQVDLSGYLPIQDGVTTYEQVYAKGTSGTQKMLDVTAYGRANTIAQRTGSGTLNVADPTQEANCVNLVYANGHYLAKQTGATDFQQAYIKKPDGTQDLLNISEVADAAIIRRKANGRIYTPNPSQDTEATNKKYVDDNFLAKQTNTSPYNKVYVKNTDGTQGMSDLTYQIVGSALVVRNASGAILVPLNPFDQYSAVSKKYVDDAVGQLLYLHDIEIIVTVDATNKLYIKAYLINGSSTAITAIDRATFKRMDVQYGAFGPNIANVNTCAVTKCPDSLRQDEFDEPYPAYLYQYMSGGSLVSGTTTYAMSVTVTDSVITF